MTTTATTTTTTAELEMGGEGEVVMTENQLQPFQHQVAGHSLMFRHGADTICKALTPRELEVYQTMPEILKPHVPKFKGVVAVNINDLENEGEDCGDDPEAKKRKAKLPSILRRLTKITHYTGNTYQFILMENIVEGYQRPCLLDLKLGVKPYVSKRPNKTSDTLGLALCGMKVYQSRTGQYVNLDKEAGRMMDENDFRQTVRHFLFNGHHIQRDLIPPFLRQLEKLKTAISQLPTFRFYSSSLLIAYDADDEHVLNGLQLPTTRTDKLRSPLSSLNSNEFPTVREQSSPCSEHRETQHLRTSVRRRSQQQELASFKTGNNANNSIKRAIGTHERKRSFSDEITGRSLHRCCSCDSDIASTGTTVPSLKRPMESADSCQRKVDVRLVDFGHTTYAGIGEETVHEGVDGNSLLGLQTLIDIFAQT